MFFIDSRGKYPVFKCYMSTFKLSKWYFDCVSDEGRAFIGYSAILSYHGIVLNYISSLNYIDNQLTEQSKVITRSSTPMEEKNRIEWTCSPLAIDGIWSNGKKPIQKMLLKDNSGYINWNCKIPSADVNLSANGTTYSGKGYVEHLVLTIKPWQLPFHQLKWGRFISDDHVLVWIDWQSDVNKTFLWHNNSFIEKAEINQTRVDFGDNMELNIDDNRVIRDGDLSNSIIKKIPMLNSIPPLKVLQTKETKWLGRGTLKNNDNQIASGWIIHENVTFY